MAKLIKKGPIVLLILDGWGIAPESESNPISQTELPNFDKLFASGQSTRLWAHGEYVGLPKDQDGNSEAGHLNLGAGRVVKQDAVIITESISDGTFFKNGAFMEAIQHVKRNNSSMHLMGLLSDGQSAHSTPKHLYALLKLLHEERVEHVYIHLFTDGRDSTPQSGKGLYKDLSEKLHPGQQVASIIGRFYGMDRTKRWNRTNLAYGAIVEGIGIKIENPEHVFDQSYAAGLTDEYINPHVIHNQGKPIGLVSENDSIISFNHRSDRARQLAKVFVQEEFVAMNRSAFERGASIKNLRFVAMSDFGPDLGDILTAYPSKDLIQTLPMVLSKMSQLYIAETEKYAHITYFFNGGYADPVGGESRIMVNSPNVKHYDDIPGMSTDKIAKKATESILNGEYEFITANIACLDMIAHTGNFDASQVALRSVDSALGKIMNAITKMKGILMVTADHGNIEEMRDLSTSEMDTEHSKNHVPFVIIGHDVQLTGLREEGMLGDVAPTVLDTMNIQKPKEMTGKSLFKGSKP